MNGPQRFGNALAIDTNAARERDAHQKLANANLACNLIQAMLGAGAYKDLTPEKISQYALETAGFIQTYVASPMEETPIIS